MSDIYVVPSSSGENHENRRGLPAWARGKLAAAALAGLFGLVGAAGGVIAGAELTRRQYAGQAGVSSEDAKSIARHAAYDSLAANTLAAYYTQELNRPPTDSGPIADMQFLNGVVSDKADPHGYKHRNLVLLGVDSQLGLTPDAKGAFLEGAYLGTVFRDTSGKLAVGVIPYDAEGNEFTPYDSKDIVISAAVRVQAGDGGPVLQVDERDGSRIVPRMNPDGSIFAPALYRDVP